MSWAIPSGFNGLKTSWMDGCKIWVFTEDASRLWYIVPIFKVTVTSEHILTS